MSFCLRPNVCKKCGKPLTLFEGWTCLECEKAEQEPSVNDVLEQIRAEISRKANSGQWSEATVYGLQKALAIIDKHMKGDTDE